MARVITVDAEEEPVAYPYVLGRNGEEVYRDATISDAETLRTTLESAL